MALRATVRQNPAAATGPRRAARPLALLLTAFALVAAVPAPAVLAANAYDAVRTVNGSAITGYDVDQRAKFLQALGAGGDTTRMALQQLTEDRLKMQAAKTLGIELPPEALEAGREEFATTRGITQADVLQVLDARGIDHQTFDDFVQAGMVWREVVGARFRSRALPTEEDIDAALQVQATTPREMIQLGEIALPFEERGEAETIALAERLSRELAAGADFASVVRTYSRSASAENGGLLEPMPADRLPPALRTQVLPLRPGQATRPIPISGGVAILKLVSIRNEAPEKIDPKDPAVRDATRQRLFMDRVTTFGQGYLQELQLDALIVER